MQRKFYRSYQSFQKAQHASIAKAECCEYRVVQVLTIDNAQIQFIYLTKFKPAALLNNKS